MAQLLLARRPYREGVPVEPSAREFADLILGMQKPEGSWDPGGQLPSQRRPRAETDEATTRWVVLSLQSLGPEDEARRAAREKAIAWLAEKKPGKSIEPLALALVMSQSESLLKELLSRQNSDGGWGWLSGEASDALATGQVLYALSLAGAKSDETIRRAWNFLVTTQGADGSWQVPSTKPKSKDLSMAAYWGTAWAAIGLLRTLPE
jgi:hypothetical protein